MLGLYGDYSEVQWNIYVQCKGKVFKEHMPVMWNTSIPVLLVTLLIAVSSDEAHSCLISAHELISICSI